MKKNSMPTQNHYTTAEPTECRWSFQETIQPLESIEIIILRLFCPEAARKEVFSVFVSD
jgi:hypothetical protein